MEKIIPYSYTQPVTSPPHLWLQIKPNWYNIDRQLIR